MLKPQFILTMKKTIPHKYLLVLIILFSYSGGSWAQNIQVTGSVLENGSDLGIPGVNILIKSTSRGTVTDLDGKFAIEVPNGQTLVFSSIGFQNQEITIGPNMPSPLTVVLQESATDLGEVVVTGYGAQSKKTISSTVTSVNAAELKEIPVPSPDQLLQGKAAGVQVSAGSGVPGGGIFVRVRGTTSINAGNNPLYIIDGVFINNQNLSTASLGGQSTNPLADLNPNDIESIEVLKDANATAIYGARGANGVVLITTKRGKINEASTISFNTYFGWAKAPKIYETVTAPQEAELINETFLNDGGEFVNRPFRPTSEGGQGLPEEQTTYSRVPDVFQTGLTQSYDLSLSGGSEKSKYFIGGGYFSQEGIVKPSGFERFSGRFNFDQSINSKLMVGTSTSISHSKRVHSKNNDSAAGVINSSLYIPTYLPVFNEDGSYARYGIFDNHLAMIENLDLSALSNRLVSNLYADYEILDGLSLRSSWSIDYNSYEDRSYNNTLITAGQPQGNASRYHSQVTTLINEQVLSYNKRFGQNLFSALLGNTIQQTKNSFLNLSGQNFPSNDFKEIGSSSLQTGSTSASSYGLLSFFSRASYNIQNKYGVDASVRADASSRFGSSNRWGYFPSLGASWVLSEESFADALPFDLIKLRANIGITGNQNGINDFASLGLWRAGNNYLQQPGISPEQLANPDLKWETTRQWNIGLDLAFLNNKVQVEANYYDKFTSDLLVQVPVAGKLGFTSIFENLGEISNKGVELSINSTNIERAGLVWTTSFNIARNVNKIESLPVPITQHSRDWIRMEEGQPLYSFWVYDQLYVDPQTGDAVFRDVNEDGQITAADRIIKGNAWPDFFGGLTNTFNYKNLDFSFMFNYEVGAEILNLNRFFMEHGGTRNGSITFLPGQLDRWQQPGDITEIPRMTRTGNNYNLPSSRLLSDASFLRLRTVSLGYTIPSETLNRLRIQRARVYVQAANLWTLTSYEGLDPEVNVAESNQNVRGIDHATVPQPRSFQVGLNLTF